MKGTKIWISGKEVEDSRWDASETIFCIYREKCEGACKHDLRLRLWEGVDEVHPLYDEIIAQNESVEGISEWFKENREDMKPNYNNYIALKTMANYLIVEVEGDSKEIKINKEFLSKYVEKTLEFELKYCPNISEEKTLKFEEIIPEKIILLDEFSKFFMPLFGDFKEEKDETEQVGFSLEAFGEEIEKRFRKVLSEFFEKKE